MEDTNIERLTFWTDGESYTSLLEDYFRSGLFSLFEKLLGDGNLNYEQKKLAFRLRMRLEGDTRTEEGLSCYFLEQDPENFPETLYYAVKTSFRGILNEDFLELDWMAEQEEASNLQVLLSYYTVEEILEICKWQILHEKGYYPSEFPESSYSTNGVILKDGTFIECGYQDHINLFPILSKLGLSDASDWTDSKEVLHISSGQINGRVAHALEDSWRGSRNEITKEQIATLWKLKEHIREAYGSYSKNTCIPNLLRNYTVTQEEQGGKYGHLLFLKNYPEVNLPFFSLELKDFEGYEKIFMRSSPEKSLPGLLNSRIISPTEHDFHKARNFMQLEFEKHSSLRGENELHWFFQELLPGKNGVCHIRKEPNLEEERSKFSYQLSSEQGAVVKGKITSEKLSPRIEEELKKIATSLFEDLKESLQIEFVVNEEKLYIVQLRILENEFETAIGNSVPEDALVKGTTFSKGSATLKREEILVVEEDADSEKLIGKKALIVESKVEFSHILALAKALKVPAIYGTGKVELPEGNLKFVAITKTGYVTI